MILNDSYIITLSKTEIFIVAAEPPRKLTIHLIQEKKLK